MRGKVFFAGAILASVVAFNGCNCGGKNGKGPDPNCPNALPGPYDEAMFDPASWPATQTVFAETLTDPADGVGGTYAHAVAGDILLSNDQVKVVVQGAGEPTAGIGAFGGNIIDADVVRAGGEPGHDRFGELIPIVHLGKVMFPESVEIQRDGSDNGPVQLKVCGPDETLDFFNLKAVVGSFGIGFDYDVLGALGLSLSNTYILPPNSNEVHIVTTIGNPSGNDIYTALGDVIHTGNTQGTFTTNKLGWSEGDLSGALETHPPTHFQAWASDDVTYGLIPAGDTQIALDISGVNAIAYGFETALGVLTSRPVKDGGGGVIHIAPGAVYSIHRTLVITDEPGVGAVSDAYYRLHEVPDTVARSGMVTEADGTTPIGGARVTILDDALNPVTSFESHADGTYGGLLPAGTYYVAADVTGRAAPTYSAGTAQTVTTLWDGNDVAASQITLDASSSTLPSVTFPAGGTIQVSVTDFVGGGPLPATVSVVGTDPTPDDTIFRDPRKDTYPGNLIRVAYARANGQVSIPIEPGTYDVYVSRGPEYSAYTENVTVGAGQTVVLNDPGPVVLERVVDTTGWVSIDGHIHMMNSPDSRVLLGDRAVSAAAAGLEVLVTTDHDYITDISADITAEGLDNWVHGVEGDEITTWDMGHFNAFPLVRDPGDPTGGAFDWMGGRGGENNLTLEQILTGVDAAHPGTQVLAINHPRNGTLQGYFDAIGLDTLTLQSKVAAEDHRVPAQPGATADDTKLFYDGFTGFEIRNGSSQGADRDNALLNDWFTFLSHGINVAGWGVSDSHTTYKDQLGWARTWVQVANDDVTQLDDETLAVGLNGGHIITSLGPFLSALVNDGMGGTNYGPGETYLNANGNLILSIFAQMPEWMDVDTIRIYSNTPDTVAPALAQNITPPLPLCEFTGITPATSVTAGGNTLKTVSQVVDLTTGACDIGTADAWLIVRVYGSAVGDLFPYVHDTGTRAEVVSNPIYIDRDGNGAYAASGPIVTAAMQPARSTALPQLQVVGPDLSPTEMEDVRTLFERVEHHH